MSFTHCLFWVRICNLPLNRHDHETLVRVGSKMGEVVDVNPADVNSWGKYARVHGRIDVSQPLKRGTVILNTKGERAWIYFRYEKLPNYCYWCGHRGHVEDDCDLKPDNVVVNEWPYGPQL